MPHASGPGRRMSSDARAIGGGIRDSTALGPAAATFSWSSGWERTCLSVRRPTSLVGAAFRRRRRVLRDADSVQSFYQ